MLQKNEAVITEARLKEMVRMRVSKRSGLWSIARPTVEEKHIDARFRTIPLCDEGE